MKSKYKILISVIAYNESNNIISTVDDLKKNNFGYDIVVINNGSTDQTKEMCKKNKIHSVNHCINTGSSMGTVLTYFMNSYRHNYDIMCQFDGDGQHIASEIKKIIKPIVDGKADYVIG